MNAITSYYAVRICYLPVYAFIYLYMLSYMLLPIVGTSHFQLWFSVLVNCVNLTPKGSPVFVE